MNFSENDMKQRESDPGSLFYGVQKWYLDQRDPCIAESGFTFRKDTPVTTRQLHNTCAASSCIALANTVITNSYDGYYENEVALNEWVHPMIEYCMFHHIPGEPCPSDPVAQLLADVEPVSSVCETQANVSILSATRGEYSNISAEVVTVADKSPIERMCAVRECDNIVYRINVMFMNNFCGLKSVPAVYLELVSEFMKLCDATSGPNWYAPRTGLHTLYWNLPGSLPLSPLPSPSPLTPTETHQPEQSSTAPSPGPPVFRPPIPRSSIEPTPSTNPASTTGTTRSNTSSSSLDSDGITAALAQTSAITTALPPSLASVTEQPDTDLGPSTPAIVSQDTTRERDSTTLQYSLVAAVVVALMLLAFVVRHRRRRNLRKHEVTVSSPDTGSSYHALDAASPSEALGVKSNRRPRLAVGCPQLPASQLVDLRILGGGGFGVVYLVRDTQNDRLLASKRLAQRSHQQPTHDELDAFVAEINLASSLSHDHIVSFVGVAGLHKTALQALFEYMDGGDLKQYLDQRPIEDMEQSSWTPEKLQISVDVADALVYLHTLEPTAVVHRDLKSRNVMLTSEKRAKLGDFGVSRTESAVGSMTTGVGTSRWVAPEVILGGGDYTTACDIYSFGVVLSELDTHRLPFAELTHGNGEPLADFAVLELVATERQQPSFSQTCPSRMLTLAKRCLSFEPGLRPSAVEIAAELRAIQEELTETDGNESNVV